jgi:hypothetical protein
MGTHMARAPIGRGQSFLQQEFEIRILKALATILAGAGAHRAIQAEPISSKLVFKTTSNLRASNQKQRLAAAI